MLLNKKPKPSRQMPGGAGQTAVGGVIGRLSGLVGAGGAFVSVPFMTWCNVPMHQAVGTAAALGFPIALANTAGYIYSGLQVQAGVPYTLGYLYLPALVVVALASVTMAPLGARTAHRSNVAALKRYFAVLLSGLAAYMLYRGLA